MSWNRVSFREKLEAQHSFPGTYLFKFIVPVSSEKKVLDLFDEDHAEVSSKKSRNGTYVSVTAEVKVSNSQEVLSIYDHAYKIEGIISL